MSQPQRGRQQQSRPAPQQQQKAAAAPAATTAVATRPDYTRALAMPTLRDELRKLQPELGRAMPATVRLNPERFVRLLMTTLQRSPKLRECSARSIFQAAMESAALGFAIEPALGHAYLVPFKGTATLMVGYRGYIALVGRSGKASAVWADAVYPRDKWQRLSGTNPQILHEPQPPVKVKQEGGAIGILEEQPLAYYACVKLLDGTVKSEWMWAEEVDDIRKRSPAVKAGMSTPWDTDYVEMGKKTVIRRLCKTADLSPEVTRAAMVDEQRELDVDAGGLALADYELPAEVAEAATDARRAELSQKYTGTPAAGMGQTGDSAARGAEDDIPETFDAAGKPLTKEEQLALDQADAAAAKQREPGAEG